MKNINDNSAAKGSSGNVWIVGTLIFLSIVVLFSSGSSEQTSSSNQNRAFVGEEGILNNNGDKSNCEGIVSVAFTKEAFDDLTNASIAHDQYGYKKVFTDGRATTVENCTKVRVIESKFAIKKVRIIEYPEIEGWIPAEWVLR